MEFSLSQKAMRQALDQVPSDFALNAAGERPASQLTRWEMGKDNPPFAALHRYGTASGTRTGIMQVISLIFANWRDAANVAKGREYIDEKFRDNEQLENGLRALADYIRARNPAPGGTSPAVHDEPVSAEGANYKIIRDLLSTYRAGAGTETTLPLRSEEETSER